MDGVYLTDEDGGLLNTSQMKKFVFVSSQERLPTLMVSNSGNDLSFSQNQGLSLSQRSLDDESQAGMAFSPVPGLDDTNPLSQNILEMSNFNPLDTSTQIQPQQNHMANMGIKYEPTYQQNAVHQSGMPSEYDDYVFAHQKAYLSPSKDLFDDERVEKFDVSVMEPLKKTKNLNYLPISDGIYAKPDILVPFQISIPQSFVDTMRTMSVYVEYKDPVMEGKPVTRCPNHLQKDDSSKRKYFLQTDDEDCVYGSEEEKYCLKFPSAKNVNLKFTCFTSCPGGINRNPIHLVFALVSRSASEPSIYNVLDLRVCANPYRDAQKDREQIEASITPAKSDLDDLKTTPTVAPVSIFTRRKRPGKITSNEIELKRQQLNFDAGGGEQVYTINVTGRGKYEAVMKFIAGLEKNERYDSLKKPDEPNVVENLSQLTWDTTINEWLNADALSMGCYVDTFQNSGILTLGDLKEMYTPNLFVSFGLSVIECAQLNKAFLNFNNCTLAADLDHLQGQ